MTSLWGRLIGTPFGAAAGGIIIEYLAFTNPVVGLAAAVCGGVTGYYGGSHIDQRNDKKTFDDMVKQEVEKTTKYFETKMNKERQEAIQKGIREKQEENRREEQRNQEREEERRKAEQSKKQLINANAEIEKMKSLQKDLQEEKLQREKLIEEKLQQEDKMNSRIEQMDAVMKSLQTNLEKEKHQQEKLIKEQKKQEEKMNYERKQMNEVVKSLQKNLEEEKRQQEKLIEEKMNSEIVKLRKVYFKPLDSFLVIETSDAKNIKNRNYQNLQDIFYQGRKISCRRVFPGNLKQGSQYNSFIRGLFELI